MVHRNLRQESGEVIVTPRVLLRELLHDADVASFTIDGLQRIRLWDEQAEHLFGFRAGRVLGHRCCDVICVAEGGFSGECPHHRSILQMASQGELPKKVIMTFLRADGITLELEVTVAPVLMGKGGNELALLHLVRRLR